MHNHILSLNELCERLENSHKERLSLLQSEGANVALIELNLFDGVVAKP